MLRISGTTGEQYGQKNLSRRAFLRTSIASGASLAAVGLHAAPVGIYQPGTYSAKASGIGDVVVTMTIESNRITDVVLDVSHETPNIGQAAAKQLRQSLLKAQSADIDAVSGASITSQAVHKAASKCIAQAKGEIPVEVITKTEEADDGDWLGKPPEIAEKDIVDTIKTEILVIGCGTGGMFAVAAAAEEGAKVIGIDRFPTGTGIRNDLAAMNSRYQKKQGTKIDKFEFIRAVTMYAAGHLQQDLVKVWCDNSGATIDWYGDRLAERGVELWHESGDSVDPAYHHHFPTGHSPRWRTSDDGTGKPLNGNKVLCDYCVKKGARFDYNTKMVKLERKSGRVTGCIATNKDGKYVRYIASKGTVVATGGYSLNYKMLEALQPWTLRVIGRNRSVPGAYGDGIRACLWVGAKMDETHASMKFDRCAIRPNQKNGPETAKSDDVGMFWMASQPWLKVNADGHRFINESGTYEAILHADEYQKGHCHYTLFDSNWTKYVQQFKMHGCSRLYPFENGADPNIPWQVFQKKYFPVLLEKGFLKKADTIEELAKKLLLPPEELVKTVKRYNQLCKEGNDVDYGKEPFRLSPLDKPPFYGAKNTGDAVIRGKAALGMNSTQASTYSDASDAASLTIWAGSVLNGRYTVGTQAQVGSGSGRSLDLLSDGTLIIAAGNDYDGSSALVTVDSATAQSGSVLRLVNAARVQNGTTVFSVVDESTAPDAYIFETDNLLTEVLDNKVVKKTAESVFGSDLIMPNTVNEAMIGASGEGVERNIALTSDSFKPDAASNALNRIALMSAAGGAQIAASHAVGMIDDSIMRHGSKLAALGHESLGADLWVDLSGSFSRAHDFKAGSANYGFKSDLAGGTVGADWNFSSAAAVGAAFSFGTGSVRGQNAASGTKNDVDYWGVNFYGVWDAGLVNMIGTIGWLQTNNDISQDGRNAAPDVSAFTMSARLEKTFALGAGYAATPHIGVRWAHINMDDFVSGGFSYENETVDLISFPIGVAFTNTFTAGTAELKPFLDMEIAPTAGDKHTDNRIGLVGGAVEDVIDTRIASSVVYSAKIGLSGNVGIAHNFGLYYGVSAGNGEYVSQQLKAAYRFIF